MNVTPALPELSALIASDRVTPATRAALEARLAVAAVRCPAFFDAAEFTTLTAICDRLIDQPERQVDVAGMLDAQLATGIGDGWRYASMPPDAETHRRGLIIIDTIATALFGEAFVALPVVKQDDVLRAVQAGDVPVSKPGFDPACYFEELLAGVTELFYSHPVASVAIGYVGMADAHGWQAIGLDECDPAEPLE